MQALIFIFGNFTNENVKITKKSNFRAAQMVEMSGFDFFKSAKIDFT